MISLNLKLLPASDNPVVSNSNQNSEQSYKHLHSLLGWQKCRKHPSFKNVINIIAVEGKDPKIEVVRVCCTDFLKTLGQR